MGKNNRFRRLYLPVAFILLLITVIITNVVSPTTNFNFVPIVAKHGMKSDSSYLNSLPVLKQYQKATIYGEHIMVIKFNDMVNFISPKTTIAIDNLYALSGILICLVFCVNFWKYDESNPFTSKLLKTIFWIEKILLVTWLINIIRHRAIRNTILKMTNNEYTLDFVPFANPEFWLYIFTVAFAKIIQQGVRLQQEQALTV